MLRISLMLDHLCKKNFDFNIYNLVTFSNPYSGLNFQYKRSLKQNENESESIILVFVLHHFHSVSQSFCRDQPNPKPSPNPYKSLIFRPPGSLNRTRMRARASFSFLFFLIFILFFYTSLKVFIRIPPFQNSLFQFLKFKLSAIISLFLF